MRRANIGCGSIQPADWVNFDADLQLADETPRVVGWDVRRKIVPYWWETFDYAVCSFMLQELDHHEIPGALTNMMAILRPGGTLRILVPDIEEAIAQFEDLNESWFPQDERTGDIEAKFCTYVTWFGTVRSVFTHIYLRTLCEPHGVVTICRFGQSQLDGITELDSREKEALIVEVTKR